MLLFALTACSLVAPAHVAGPAAIDRGTGLVDLGAPNGASEVQVVSFHADDAGHWALAGVVDTGAGTTRWLARVDPDGTVHHQLLGPGRIQDTDLAPDGSLWVVGFAEEGKPWIAGFDPSGTPLGEARPQPAFSGELWAVRARGEGALAVGIDVPLVSGRGDVWWLGVDGAGAVVETRHHHGFGYSYAFEVDVAPDGAAIAVGAVDHRARTWTPDGDGLVDHKGARDVLSRLSQVRRSGDAWLALGTARATTEDRAHAGQLVLVRLVDEGSPEPLAWTDVQGSPGDPASLWVDGDRAWLHTLAIHGNRWKPWSNRVFRREGDRLESVGEAREGWGALAVTPSGEAWRAWWSEGSVRAERLDR